MTLRVGGRTFVHPCYTRTEGAQVALAAPDPWVAVPECALTLCKVAIRLDTCSLALHTPGIVGDRPALWRRSHMRTDPTGRIGLRRLAGLFAIGGLLVAACSSGTASTAPSAAASVAAPTTAASAAASAAAAPSVNDKLLEIAYLSFAVANSYDAPMLAAAKAAAAAGNANLTVFDANLDPADQVEAAPGRGRVGQVRRDHHPAAVRRGHGRGRQEGHRRGHQGRQHRPGPRRRHDDAELAGRRPELERRVRPERARQEDRQPRRHRLRRSQGRRSPPVQRRLHLVGQGRRARHRPQEGLRRGDRQPSRDQGRVRHRRVVLHDGRSA